MLAERGLCCLGRDHPAESSGLGTHFRQTAAVESVGGTTTVDIEWSGGRGAGRLSRGKGVYRWAPPVYPGWAEDDAPGSRRWTAWDLFTVTAAQCGDAGLSALGGAQAGVRMASRYMVVIGTGKL